MILNNAEKPTIAVIDFHMGNLFSVLNACEFVGFTPFVVNSGDELLKFDTAILPGVGAFGDAMENLKSLDLISPIRDFIASGKNLVGVCLGMQLLFSESEEFGLSKGLNIIPGRVVRFPKTNSNGQRIKVPQVGWNKIFFDSVCSGKNNLMLNNIANEEFMYFVHSYYVIPQKADVVLCTTNFEGISYCSGIYKDNVIAFQFHPEKSGLKGLEMYKNLKMIAMEKNNDSQ
jgi:glutamine amidotransferase